MTGKLPLKKVIISRGKPSSLAKSKNETLTFSALAKLFEQPFVTPEKFHQYKKASDQEQRRLKGINGWFIRCKIEGGRRNRNSVMPSQLITLDLDYATPEFVDLVLKGKVLPGVAYIVHSSRSHTPEKPRLRMVIPLHKNLPAEGYSRVSRIVAQSVDPEMEVVDPVSFRPAQMMYMPSVSVDMEQHYIYSAQGGDLLDWEEIVKDWESVNGSSYDLSNLPRCATEPELREVADEAEDPLTKTGPVGDFCRAWSITELVMGKQDDDGVYHEGPLADKYEIVEWSDGEASRMTYLGGSTSNGAQVFEDKFIYSHHGSDPGSDQLLNAYDLLRVHLFEGKDDDVEEGTPISKRPSVVAMKEWTKDDPFYKIQQAESRYDLESKFLDDDVEVDEEDDSDEPEDEDEQSVDDLLGVPLSSVVQNPLPSTQSRLVEKPPKRWLAKEVELTDDGIIKTTLFNITTIVSNDPRLWRKVRYNRFSQEIVLVAPIKTKAKLISDIDCHDQVNGDRWQDVFDMTVRAIIEGPAGSGKPGYGIKVGKELVADSIKLAAQNNSFHPIIEYLDGLEGEPDRELAETFWIRHAGVKDDPYTREATLLMGIASVARVMEPGHKWDHAIILEGPQGIGKSTAIKRLYGSAYFGELHTDLKDEKKSAEAIMGNWAMELPELSALHKSDHNDAKAFITRQDDDVRLSYDRHVSRLPRQCVFFGTSNDSEYLRDPTGNRRFWPFVCDTDSIDTAGILRERDAFWRTCYAIYKDMRRATNGDLELVLSPEAAKIAQKMQESRRKMEMWETWYQALMDWMDEPITLRQLLMEWGHDEFETEFKGLDIEKTWVRRMGFSQDYAFTTVVGTHGNLPSNNVVDLAWKRVLAKCEEDGWERLPHATFLGGKREGKRARWTTHPRMTPADRATGFWIDSSPDGSDESDPPVDDNPLI